MTWQTHTTEAVDEAFWELVWSDPDLLAADLRDLAEHDCLPPPPDRTPPTDRPAGTPPWLVRSAWDIPKWPPSGAHRAPSAASGRVRSPPARADTGRRPVRAV